MSDSIDRHLEKRLDGALVFDGKLLKVWRDKVSREDAPGQQFTREYVRHQGACMVIAITDSGKLILERQYRYPLDLILLEVPAGKIDPGEDPEVCARRELQEETGFNAREWRRLGTVHPAVGYSDEGIHLFLAQGLEYVGQNLDAGEYLEVVEMSLDEAEAAVLSGEITDGKTISAIFWARKVLQG